MPLRNVTFIGNPNDPRDGQREVKMFGEVYHLNETRAVELSADTLKRLSGNAHFKVEAVPGEPEAPAPESGGLPQGEGAEGEAGTSTDAAPSGDARKRGGSKSK